VTFTLAGPDGVELSDEVSRLDVDQIHAWLKASYWAHDRDRETLDRALANSRPYGVYAPDGSQIAFTRAVTDLAAFCWIADVVVDDAWRGRGLGTWMMGAITDHLRGLGVPRFVLATRDAHGVYEKVGFGPLRVPVTWMEIDTRATRPNPDDFATR